eukprot:gene28847-50747_t
MAMAALETGKRTASQITQDNGSWFFGGHVFRSHGDAGLGPVDMYRSIVKSSNVYYYSLANDLGVDAIHDFMKPLGFGQLTGIDIQGEVRGVLPSQDWKRRYYKRPEQQKWYAGETISLGIGQGYNTFTMLQLASATASTAARTAPVCGSVVKPKLDGSNGRGHRFADLFGRTFANTKQHHTAGSQAGGTVNKQCFTHFGLKITGLQGLGNQDRKRIFGRLERGAYQNNLRIAFFFGSGAQGKSVEFKVHNW